jgi:hypothetical protein
MTLAQTRSLLVRPCSSTSGSPDPSRNMRRAYRGALAVDVRRHEEVDAGGESRVGAARVCSAATPPENVSHEPGEISETSSSARSAPRCANGDLANEGIKRAADASSASAAHCPTNPRAEIARPARSCRRPERWRRPPGCRDSPWSASSAARSRSGQSRPRWTPAAPANSGRGRPNRRRSPCSR